MNLSSLAEKYGLRYLVPLLEQHTLPAIAFSLSGAPVSRSVFGGAPLVPPGFEWPTYTPVPLEWTRSDGGTTRIAPAPCAPNFLLQIDLAEICHFAAASVLPRHGLLTFFYDVENQPWGHEPADKGGFRVCWFDGADLTSRVPPCPALIRRGMLFSHAETLPRSETREHSELTAQAELPDSYFDFNEEFERQSYGAEQPLHRILGHCTNLQGAMDRQAQLVSNGFYDTSEHDGPRRRECEKGASEWILLLQLDTDNGVRLEWGLSGIIYFWIRRSDLAARRFERSWCILQGT